MMRTIFRAGGKTIGIRLAMPFCSVVGVAMTWVGWMFIQPSSYQGDDALSGPIGLGMLFGLVFLLGGLGIAIGSWLYGPAYVSRIEVDREEDRVRFSVAGWVRGRSFTVHPEDVVSGRYHDGHYDSGRTMVNAPWTTVRVRGRRLPLIVDERAAYADWWAVDRLTRHQSIALEQPRAAVAAVPTKKRKKKRG
jgi:hypothetical protein